jgi:hypothetical protein
MSTLRLRAYGRIVGIGGSDQILELARERLPPSYRPAAEAPERIWAVRRSENGNWIVHAGGVELSVHDSQTAATDTMLSHLELWVAEHARRAVFIHAGCAVVGGRAIVVPGYSLSGKSTLTAALVRTGAEYYSDEFAVLDHRGDVRPYPRPLSMRAAPNTAERVAVEDLGGRVGRGPVRVGLIASLIYDANAGFMIESQTGSRGALLLVPHAVPSRSRPRATLNAVAHAAAGAIAVTGTRGDADDAAARLLELLRSADTPSRR